MRCDSEKMVFVCNGSPIFSSPILMVPRAPSSIRFAREFHSGVLSRSMYVHVTLTFEKQYLVAIEIGKSTFSNEKKTNGD